jgi:hypothetical protein
MKRIVVLDVSSFVAELNERYRRYFEDENEVSIVEEEFDKRKKSRSWKEWRASQYRTGQHQAKRRNKALPLRECFDSCVC